MNRDDIQLVATGVRFVRNVGHFQKEFLGWSIFSSPSAACSVQTTNVATNKELCHIFLGLWQQRLLLGRHRYCYWQRLFVPSSVTRWQHYFFIIWQLTAKKICPIASEIYQISHKFCQILNRPFKNCPKYFKIFLKWRNFAKSGHNKFTSYLWEH